MDENAISQSAHKVTVYSTPSCHFCHAAKAFFNEHKVPFKDIDVSEDIDAQKEMIEKSQQLGVPVIEIDGEIVIGFDQDRLMQLLDLQ